MSAEHIVCIHRALSFALTTRALLRAILIWNRIEDDEVAGIEGKASQLASLLQRKHGYTEYHAESQSIRWMRQHRDEHEVTS